MRVYKEKLESKYKIKESSPIYSSRQSTYLPVVDKYIFSEAEHPHVLK
jgi:hypothetical protein